MSEELQYTDINKSFEAALERSHKIEEDLIKNPKKYRVLTGDRPVCSISDTISALFRTVCAWQIWVFQQ